MKKTEIVKDNNKSEIQGGRIRHLTRKNENGKKIEIEPKIPNEINKSKIEYNFRTNNEETFKNSIRNKYKRRNREKNNFNY